MRKVLLSTTIENTLPIGKALRQLGYEVRIFNAALKHQLDQYFFKQINKTLWNLRLMDKGKSLGRDSRYNNRNFIAMKLEQQIKEFKPDILFFEIGYKPPLRLLERLSDYGVKRIVAWWTTTSNWMSMEETDASFYDAVFFFCRKLIPHATAKGFRAFYLPHGANSYLFRKVDLSVEDLRRFACDIVFVGECKPARRKAVNKILEHDIHIWGPKWKFENWWDYRLIRRVRGSGLFGEDLVKQYNAAKIVLNINAWSGDVTGGMNQRVFDVPVCGSFLLTDYCDELDDYYKIGEEIETFRTTEEMKDKVDFYLKNEKARNHIASRGYERSMQLPHLEEKIKEAMRIAEAF